MIKVQLPDLRIIEVTTLKKAEAYATAMGGTVLKEGTTAKVRGKLKQFFERG